MFKLLTSDEHNENLKLLDLTIGEYQNRIIRTPADMAIIRNSAVLQQNTKFDKSVRLFDVDVDDLPPRTSYQYPRLLISGECMLTSA